MNEGKNMKMWNFKMNEIYKIMVVIVESGPILELGLLGGWIEQPPSRGATMGRRRKCWSSANMF